MKVTVQGWRRDMGTKELASHDLSELRISDEWVQTNVPTIFRLQGELSVCWHQELKLTGNYRMQIQFSRSDVMRLFKSMFGSELSASLIEEHEFTISPQLKKAILRTVKLSDLTLGDVAAMIGSSSVEESATAEKLVEPTNVRPFPRRF
jgi:hypothetical protein